MSSGFNTDIKVGERVFHVQTEDRGPNHPVIDTVVYQSGRILHRKSHNYEKFATTPEFSPDELRRQVESQHRAVIETIRSGGLDADVAAADAIATEARPGGIQIQLLNPGSWLSAGKVSLDVEVSRRADKQPQAGAHVDAKIEGALRDGSHSAESDDQGRVRIQFPLPPLGKGDLALVIRAKAEAAKPGWKASVTSRPPG